MQRSGTEHFQVQLFFQVVLFHALRASAAAGPAQIQNQGDADDAQNCEYGNKTAAHSLDRSHLHSLPGRRCLYRSTRIVKSHDFELDGAGLILPLLDFFTLNFREAEAGRTLHVADQLQTVVMFFAVDDQFQLEPVVRRGRLAFRSNRMDSHHKSAARHDLFQIRKELRPGELALLDDVVPEIRLLHGITVFSAVADGLVLRAVPVYFFDLPAELVDALPVTDSVSMVFPGPCSQADGDDQGQSQGRSPAKIKLAGIFIFL